MSKNDHLVEVLSFVNGDITATIATDGKRHVSQIIAQAKEHRTLSAAISYLEAQGFSIEPSNFRSL